MKADDSSTVGYVWKRLIMGTVVGAIGCMLAPRDICCETGTSVFDTISTQPRPACSATKYRFVSNSIEYSLLESNH